MSRVLRRVSVCSIAFAILVAHYADAAEYRIEFSSDGVGIKVVDILGSEIDPTPWHTINRADGVNLRNSAGIDIVSVRVRARQSGVTFLVPQTAGAGVFQTVWRRKDNTEVAFLDGKIKKGAVIWNRVDDTSGATGTTADIFEGQIYEDNYKIADPQNWVLVTSTFEHGVPDKWRKLLRSLPEGYSSIQCYSESNDGGKVFFVSRGFPFVYDSTTDELRPIVLRKLLPIDINRISVTKDSIELWSSGANVASIPLGEKKSFGKPLNRD